MSKVKYRCGAPVQSITSKRYAKGGTGKCRKPVKVEGKLCYWHQVEAIVNAP